MANLEDVPSVDLMRELLRRMKCSSSNKPDKHLVLVESPFESRTEDSSMVESKFPYDVLADVLSRLFVKDLMRFKCVSKQWNCLISDPLFVKLHTQRSQQKKLFLHFTCQQEGIVRRFLGQSETSFQFTTTDHQGKVLREFTCKQYGFSESDDIRYVLSCNNLICFSRTFSRSNWRSKYVLLSCDIYIFNPVTQEIVKLPNKPGEELTHAFGFGYLSSTKEFKVVRGVFKRNNNPQWEIFTFRSSPGRLHGTNSSSSSWRVLNNGRDILSKMTPVFVNVNGSLNWLSFSLNDSYRFVSFDLEREFFRYLPLPHRTEVPNSHEFFGNVGGNLSLFNDSTYDNGQPFMKVWILEDYQRGIWTPSYNIDLMPTVDRGLDDLSDLYQLHNVMDNELLIIPGDHLNVMHRYYFYNMEQQTCRKIQVPAQKGQICFYMDRM